MHHGEKKMNFEKLIEKLPDVYFDWYARLLPGAIALAIYFYLGKVPPDPSAGWLFIYAAIAYVAGHIVQPPSSLCIVGLRKVIRSNESLYEKEKKNKALAGQVSKVSKAHAESVGMLSTCFLISLVAFHLSNWGLITLILIAYFLLAAFERSWARKRKIEALKN